MHGGSGIPFDVIRQARAFHLLKINYGSDLRREFIRTFGEAYEANHGAHNVMSLSVKAVENVRNKARELVTRINEA
jgi:fructose-bisphosphate aldolase, class II